MVNITTNNQLKVKVLSKVREKEWLRYFPGGTSKWSNCQFVFSQDARQYDWLVVYDDLPPQDKERFSLNEEYLSCPIHNTLLVTTEPLIIKVYGNAYTSQFGHVLTSQEEWTLPHPKRIFSQPALHWYYGVSSKGFLAWDEMHADRPTKDKSIATVCATKQHKIARHRQREFITSELKAAIPGIDIYGRGVRHMDDKADAIRDYFYHVAIENFIGKHHWTEKLPDSFLGLTLPFYDGCPNMAHYFPEESFIPIDIFKPDEAIELIKKTIHDNEYTLRFDSIIEARRRVLEEYNFFAVVSALIEERHQPGKAANIPLLSRRAVTRASPVNAINQLVAKLRIRLIHRFNT